jgi:hypothetical protein
MDCNAFGAATFDYSNPTVRSAVDLTSMADQSAGGEARSYLNSAFSGSMVTVDPKMIQIQSKALQASNLEDLAVIDDVARDDPGGGGFLEYDSGTMGEDVAYAEEPPAAKYKNYLIAGGILAGGLGLIWYLRR